MPARKTRTAYRGCLLGGAVGDALGAPVEFADLADIRAVHGPEGVRDLVDGTITDDTQMTLFSAEALLRARHLADAHGTASLPEVAHGSYLRWLHTQGERTRGGRGGAQGLDGWLLGVRPLHARRAPGLTCLSALRSGRMGRPEAPLNDSKGCGGVMRVAPVGLAAGGEAFGAGCDLAAITHGHPSGWLAAGYLAETIRLMVAGRDLRAAAREALAPLRERRGHRETLEAVEDALALASGDPPSAEQVEQLGEGWVAEEALAIGLYCAVVARDFAHGVLLAVNHGGDSDSTGAIAGHLLGLVHGEAGIPAPWLERLELREVIAQVADDLWTHFGEPRDRCDDLDRYPAG
jgi:ADP-ribosylglycohydrolase